MPFFLIQRGIELLLLHLLWDKFAACVTCAELLHNFLAMDELARIGTLTVIVIVLVSVGDTLRKLLGFLWARRSTN
jgi:hypothetical protein